MTKREFFEAVKNANINDELTSFAEESLAQLDHTNELRKVAAAKRSAAKAAEKAPIRDAIVSVITKDAKTASMLIAEAGVEIKPQAVPSLLKALVEDGTIMKTEVKVTGKGKQVGYVLA